MIRIKKYGLKCIFDRQSLVELKALKTILSLITEKKIAKQRERERQSWFDWFRFNFIPKEKALIFFYLELICSSRFNYHLIIAIKSLTFLSRIDLFILFYSIEVFFVSKYYESGLNFVWSSKKFLTLLWWWWSIIGMIREWLSSFEDKSNLSSSSCISLNKQSLLIREILGFRKKSSYDDISLIDATMLVEESSKLLRQKSKSKWKRSRLREGERLHSTMIIIIIESIH